MYLVYIHKILYYEDTKMHLQCLFKTDMQYWLIIWVVYTRWNLDIWNGYGIIKHNFICHTACTLDKVHIKTFTRNYMKSPIKRYIRNYPYFKVILYKGIFLYSIID